MIDPTETSYWCEEVLETSEHDLPVWSGNKGSTVTEAGLAERLSQAHHVALLGVLEEFSDIFQEKPGTTLVMEHAIETGSTQPVRLPQYRLSHAYRQAVKDVLEEMVPQELLNQRQMSGVSQLFQ